MIRKKYRYVKISKDTNTNENAENKMKMRALDTAGGRGERAIRW